MLNTRTIFGLLALLSIVLCCLTISEPITKDLKREDKDDILKREDKDDILKREEKDLEREDKDLEREEKDLKLDDDDDDELLKREEKDMKLKDKNKVYSDKKDHMTNTERKPTKREMIHYNYIRLPESKCFDGSTYKCTNKKTNLGGSEWCIMLFPDAIAHCDADPLCTGYAINLAQSFRTKYDRNGQRAVHLVKVGEKTVPCSSTEWSGYEKQKTVRSIPTVFGTSTCDEIVEQKSCSSIPQHFDYNFVSKSKMETGTGPYLCKDNEKNLDKKELTCILPIVEAVHVCNLDEKCDGFIISTDEAWQKEYSRDGLQAVQLFGKGVKFTLDDKWRSFQKRL